MNTVVRLEWHRNYDQTYRWNEVCAWAMEYFGLPGGRYRTTVNVDYMDFIFNDSKDALMMSIRWGGKIIKEEDLYV